jgi:thiol-disulfide isomerase/thioredoxin
MLFYAAVVLAGGLLLFLGLVAGPQRTQRTSGSGGFGGLEVGKQAPPIMAAGWLNGEAPSPEDLAGKVLVIDAWTTWCRPCRESAPHLIELYHKFRGRGVVFIGLTREEEDVLPAIRDFLNDTGIPWRNGYGAAATLDQFRDIYIPTLWVIGVDGKVAWNLDSAQPLDEAIEAALAAAPQK